MSKSSSFGSSGRPSTAPMVRSVPQRSSGDISHNSSSSSNKRSSVERPSTGVRSGGRPSTGSIPSHGRPSTASRISLRSNTNTSDFTERATISDIRKLSDPNAPTPLRRASTAGRQRPSTGTKKPKRAQSAGLSRSGTKSKKHFKNATDPINDDEVEEFEDQLLSTIQEVTHQKIKRAKSAGHSRKGNHANAEGEESESPRPQKKKARAKSAGLSRSGTTAKALLQNNTDPETGEVQQRPLMSQITAGLNAINAARKFKSKKKRPQSAPLKPPEMMMTPEHQIPPAAYEIWHKKKNETEVEKENAMLQQKLKIAFAELQIKLKSNASDHLKRRINQLQQDIIKIESNANEEISRWRKLAGPAADQIAALHKDITVWKEKFEEVETERLFYKRQTELATKTAADAAQSCQTTWMIPEAVKIDPWRDINDLSLKRSLQHLINIAGDTINSGTERFQQQLKDARKETERLVKLEIDKSNQEMQQTRQHYESEMRIQKKAIEKESEREINFLEKEVKELNARIRGLVGDADEAAAEQRRQQEERERQVSKSCPQHDPDGQRRLEHVLFGKQYDYQAEIDALKRENRVLRMAMREEKARRTMANWQGCQEITGIPECEGLDELDWSRAPEFQM